MGKELKTAGVLKGEHGAALKATSASVEDKDDAPKPKPKPKITDDMPRWMKYRIANGLPIEDQDAAEAPAEDKDAATE